MFLPLDQGSLRVHRPWASQILGACYKCMLLGTPWWIRNPRQEPSTSTLHKGHGDSYTHQGLRPGHARRLETRRDARDSLQADMLNGTMAEEVCVWVLSVTETSPAASFPTGGRTGNHSTPLCTGGSPCRSSGLLRGEGLRQHLEFVPPLGQSGLLSFQSLFLNCKLLPGRRKPSLTI